MSDAITDKTILDIVEEGKNNFVSSRFDDAAKLFGSAVRNLEKHEYDIDAIYFSYARIVALEKAEKSEKQIQALMNLSHRCLLTALKQALDEQKNHSNSLEKTGYMNYAQKIMKELGRDEERESIVLSLVQLYKSLIEDKKITIDVKELFQERIIEFCSEYDHPNLTEEYEKIKLAKLLTNIGDDLINSGKLHIDVIVADKYIRAAAIYREFSMKNQMKDLLLKALRASKHSQFDKYEFVKIERPHRAKDENGKELDPDPDMADDKINEYLNKILKEIDQSVDSNYM